MLLLYLTLALDKPRIGLGVRVPRNTAGTCPGPGHWHFYNCIQVPPMEKSFLFLAPYL